MTELEKAARAVLAVHDKRQIVEYMDEMDALREALAEESSGTEQPAQQCWQPIETAPQDGSFVDLLVSPRTGKRRRVIDAWWTELTGWRNDYGALDFGLTPTHWMPPPPEPETQPAQHIDPETRTKDGLKYSPNYVAGYNNGLKAAQQQEPVAAETTIDIFADHEGTVYATEFLPSGTKLYTSPPASKPWVGLTKQEIDKIYRDLPHPVPHWQLSRAIEAKLREKNS